MLLLFSSSNVILNYLIMYSWFWVVLAFWKSLKITQLHIISHHDIFIFNTLIKWHYLNLIRSCFFSFMYHFENVLCILRMLLASFIEVLDSFWILDFLRNHFYFKYKKFSQVSMLSFFFTLTFAFYTIILICICLLIFVGNRAAR